jgi:site-specific recombinase XerD
MRKSDRNSARHAPEPQVLGEVIIEYLRFIRGAAGYSKSTFKSYQSQLRRFDRWLSGRVNRPALLGDITARLFREYIVELTEAGCRPRTVRAAVMPVRSMMTYLVDGDRLEASPIHSVRLPKKDAAQRPRVTDEELLAVLSGCDRMVGTQRPLMTKALLLTLITAAVRRSELLGLKVNDFHRENGQILITHGKGAKSRAIFLTEETQAAIEPWLKVRPRCKHDYLFIVDVNRRLRHLGLHSLLEEAKAAAGLKDHDNIQPHAIRHAAASRMLQRGMDLKSIQTMLGHANINTTAIYLHTGEAHLRSVAHLTSLCPDGAVMGKHPAESGSPPEPPLRELQNQPGRHSEVEKEATLSSRYRRTARPPAREARHTSHDGHSSQAVSSPQPEQPAARPRRSQWILQHRHRG